MKSRRKILLAGLSIIIVTNVFALTGIAYNRSGQPDALVELSERELSMPYRYGGNRENTGLGLSFNCRIENYAYDYVYTNNQCSGNPQWLDSTKLVQLGFDEPPRADHDNEYRRDDNILPRKVFLVLEMDGESYQRALADKVRKLAEARDLLANNLASEEFAKRVERARDFLQNEQQRNSRLFAIDAGLEKSSLRKKYADRGRYILVQALIKPDYYRNRNSLKSAGIITGILIRQINIPLEHRDLFKSFESSLPYPDQGDFTPRYTVGVAFGQRSEPWVVAVKKYKAESR